MRDARLRVSEIEILLEGLALNAGREVHQGSLVVEDEWLVRDVIVSYLKEAGWGGAEASTGESAIGLLENTPKIDVLVTDIQLAGDLSGWDVAEAARA